MPVLPGPYDDPYTHPYERPELPAGATWGHTPEHHAGQYVYPGRAVLMLPGHEWPERPETCTAAITDTKRYGDDGNGGWTVAVCAGCGLDGT